MEVHTPNPPRRQIRAQHTALTITVYQAYAAARGLLPQERVYLRRG